MTWHKQEHRNHVELESKASPLFPITVFSFPSLLPRPHAGNQKQLSGDSADDGVSGDFEKSHRKQQPVTGGTGTHLPARVSGAVHAREARPLSAAHAGHFVAGIRPLPHQAKVSAYGKTIQPPKNLESDQTTQQAGRILTLSHKSKACLQCLKRPYAAFGKKAHFALCRTCGGTASVKQVVPQRLMLKTDLLKWDLKGSNYNQPDEKDRNPRLTTLSCNIKSFESFEHAYSGGCCKVCRDPV